MAAAAARRALLAALLAAALARGEPGGQDAGPLARWASGLLGLASRHSDRPGAYEQCGGHGGAKECQSGCLCVRKNDYFSGCKPVPGESQCNAAAARGYLAMKKHRARPMQRKKERTARTKAEKAKAFTDSTRSAAELRLAALRELSARQLVDEAATMGAVERDNMQKIGKEVARLKEATDALEHTKAVAEEEAHPPVHKAHEALEAARKHLEEVRAASERAVANTTAIEEEKVQAANETMITELNKALGPELERRKAVAAAAKKKATETAEAKAKAIKDKADAKDAMDTAADDAEAAEKELKPAEDMVAKWKSALL